MDFFLVLYKWSVQYEAHICYLMLSRFTPSLIYFKSWPSFSVCLKISILTKHTKGHHNPHVPSTPYAGLPFTIQPCESICIITFAYVEC